ncbi:tRNA pseudouridine(55) synthase TruB [Saccharibacillus sp. CPCC 101409]|uniref:tRNA pseudouridine(55) synthase TruB n=1 Tax=Saccharibacillus sp. CPCC 101409 TaxID=3058041 RepID=UPI0026737582|nr:tRNA pseudouridine(55) synthase TruB [Saccharibacillus sp. CPCC 101409]MDO3410653.1 tRNA pseudouridine(55) synthase TruB [Saccharibacillus sp. CPCC 101409]
MNEFDGVLPVYKPAGMTSHDVVAKCRRLLKMKRIGHTGTLDPSVTGVLPLCLGRATRMVEYLQEMPKEYRAVLKLGIATDTEDLTGTVVERMDVVEVREERMREVLEEFRGPIMQTPPMYSAVKVDGKRLYELAREGKTVERKARQVSIHELELTGFESLDQPEASLRVLCSKGTYIRTLCVDIGARLGVPSAMAELKRTLSAGIGVDRCLTFEEIERRMEEGTLEEALLRADKAASHMPEHVVDERKLENALRGQKLPAWAVLPSAEGAQEQFRLYAPDDRFIGIYKWDEEAGKIVPVKVFLP